MSPKKPTPFLSKDYAIAFTSPELTIHSEKGEPIVYDPTILEDVKKLTKAAKLEKFLKDKNKDFPHLLVFESQRYARGVVANEPIKRNRVICEYTGQIASLDKMTDRKRVKKILLKEAAFASPDALEKAIDQYIEFISAYAFELTRKSGERDTVLAHRHRSLAAFINHHTTDPNVHVDVIKETIRFIASRDIGKGEQLRIDYGPDYEYKDPTYYIPMSENQLRRGTFLADNLQYYTQKPVKLSTLQKKTLETSADYVMVPLFVSKLLAKKNVNLDKLSGYEKRLPIIELIHSEQKETKKNLHVYIPEDQQNILPFLFAAVLHDEFAIKKMAKDESIDLFSKSLRNRDALIFLLKSLRSEDDFIRIAKPLLVLLKDHVKRIDYLGTDKDYNTALHLIVQRGWDQSIKWFDQKTFFAVVDLQDFDPFMLSIALGKIDVLKAFLKLKYVKRHLKSLLLIREDIGETNDFVLKRALKLTPRKALDEIKGLLKKYAKRINKLNGILDSF